MKNLMLALLILMLGIAAACNKADHNTAKQIDSKMKSAYLDRVDVSVKDGVVTLKGEVNNTLQKSAAETIAEKTPGVKSVNDKLRVVYQEGLPSEKGVLVPTPTDNQQPGNSNTQDYYGKPGYNQNPTGTIGNQPVATPNPSPKAGSDQGPTPVPDVNSISRGSNSSGSTDATPNTELKGAYDSGVKPPDSSGKQNRSQNQPKK